MQQRGRCAEVASYLEHSGAGVVTDEVQRCGSVLLHAHSRDQSRWRTLPGGGPLRIAPATAVIAAVGPCSRPLCSRFPRSSPLCVCTSPLWSSPLRQQLRQRYQLAFEA